MTQTRKSVHYTRPDFYHHGTLRTDESLEPIEMEKIEHISSKYDKLIKYDSKNNELILDDDGKMKEAGLNKTQSATNNFRLNKSSTRHIVRNLVTSRKTP